MPPSGALQNPIPAEHRSAGFLFSPEVSMDETERARAERIRRALDELITRIAKAVVADLRKRQREAPKIFEPESEPPKEG